MRVEGVTALYKDDVVKQSTVETNIKQPAEPEEGKVLLIGERELKGAVKTANKRLESYNRRVQFSIHEKTGDVMIKIYDAITNEVIREIPPEKIKDMIANMLEQAGLLVDERV